MKPENGIDQQGKTAPALTGTQEQFAAAIFDANRLDANLIQSLPGERLTPQQRLAVYRRNVYTNLRGALADIFPIVKQLVGPAFFDTAADKYIEKVPSLSGDLNDYGDQWPDFLANYAPTANLPWLPDVARLEWLWHASFHAAEHDTLDLARLVDVPAERQVSLVFRLHPAARLMTSSFPLLQLWEVHQSDYQGEMAVNWDVETEYLLIHRRDADTLITQLEPAAWVFLSAIDKGETLESGVTQALARDPAFDLQTFLIQCVQQNLIVDFGESPHAPA